MSSRVASRRACGATASTSTSPTTTRRRRTRSSRCRSRRRRPRRRRAFARTSAAVQNSGLEAQINATLVDTRRFGWDMTVSRVAQQQQGRCRSASIRRAIPNKTIGTGSTARLGRLPGERRLPAAVSLHRRERRRHHPDDRSSRSTRASSTAGTRSRATCSPFRTESICSRASCASTRCSTTRAASTCFNNTW